MVIPVTQLQHQAESAVALRNDELREAEEFARQRAAYNALRQTYGDIAGDPQTALQLQEHGFRGEMNPLKIDHQQLTNTGLADRNNFLRQSYPLQIEGLELGNEGARLGNESTTLANREDENTLREKALVDGARYVKRRVSEGADIATAFDEIAPQLPVTPDQAAELRAALTSDPAQLDAFLDTYAAQQGGVETGVTPHFGVDENNNVVPLMATKDGRIIRPELPPGVTFQKEPIKVDMGAQGTGLLDPISRRLIGVIPKTDLSPDQRVVTDDEGNVTGAEAIPGSTLDMERQAEAAEAEANQLAREAIAGSVAAPVLRTINRSLGEYIPAMTQGDSVIAANQRWAKSFLPGTPEYNFSKEMMTPKSNISLERLNQMRQASATGASGLGQVTQTEHDMLMASWGSVDPTLPPDKLRENVISLHNTFLDVLHGTKKQRDRLVARGALDPKVSAAIDEQYMSTEFDEFGDQQQDDIGDDELRNRLREEFGGDW